LFSHPAALFGVCRQRILAKQRFGIVGKLLSAMQLSNKNGA
jgi:hypothetical protein